MNGLLEVEHADLGKLGNFSGVNGIEIRRTKPRLSNWQVSKVWNKQFFAKSVWTACWHQYAERVRFRSRSPPQQCLPWLHSLILCHQIHRMDLESTTAFLTRWSWTLEEIWALIKSMAQLAKNACCRSLWYLETKTKEKDKWSKKLTPVVVTSPLLLGCYENPS